MRVDVFHALLDIVCQRLTTEARTAGFNKALEFEQRVREVIQITADDVDSGRLLLKCANADDLPLNLHIDMAPPAQIFPDIVLGNTGVEVKFTESDTWRCIANSVLESHKVDVEHICVLYGKMGGTPEVRYDDWEHAIMHVRTSHVPRFELQIGAEKSLFEIMGISYNDFSQLPMSAKMVYIRAYARSRLKEGEHLWWLDESDDAAETHTTPMNVRLYTNLTMAEKSRMRAEGILLCPQVLMSGRSRHKYDDLVGFMMTYHGVLCHQARDLFSAGSAAGVGGNGVVRQTKIERELEGKDFDGIYILRALLHLESDMIAAAGYMEDGLFEEYWGEDIGRRIDIKNPKARLRYWLGMADYIDW